MTHTSSRRRVALVGVLAIAWVAGSVLGATDRPRPAAAAPLFQLEPAHASYVPVLDGSEPIFVLVIGSDARPDEEIASTRADSLHIVALNPAKHKATIVGIPRDSFVDIPDHGQNKINSALFYGGPELVVETVEELTGITFDYWAMTGFETFETMVNGVDGLVVDVPMAMDDAFSHAFFEPGVQRLNGGDALAFARNRHDLLAGDFGRSENQGLLMVAALAQFKREFTKDPGRMLIWLSSFLQHAQTSVALDELMDLAFTGTTISPKRVVNAVFPGGTGFVGNMSVVNLDPEAVQTISRDIEKDGLLKVANIPPSPNARQIGEA
ncbi:MAG TPA: LCP family protein [Actinomycetota bacterium]|nr:LCP family protein [Actinomycetota bacterium]